MAAPNAPLPLLYQIKTGVTITITLPLRAIGPGPTFVDGAGGGWNPGDPTATFSIVIPPVGTGVPGGGIEQMPNRLVDMITAIEDLWFNGLATVS